MVITSLELSAGAWQTVGVRAFDADGVQLEARGGIDVTNTDLNILDVEGLSTSETIVAGVYTATVHVHALQAGRAALIFRASNATTILPVFIH
jgi:hypothetical protein